MAMKRTWRMLASTWAGSLGMTGSTNWKQVSMKTVRLGRPEIRLDSRPRGLRGFVAKDTEDEPVDQVRQKDGCAKQEDGDEPSVR